MQLSEAISAYVDAFSQKDADPRSAFDAIERFRESNCELSADLIQEMILILGQRDSRWLPQLGVAQILWGYRNLDEALLEPLLGAAIEIQNPSVNRDFLTPCLKSFGAERVSEWLAETFTDADLVHRIGISSLVYWLDYYPIDVEELFRRKRNGLEVDGWMAHRAIDAGPLKKVIAEASRRTDNLVERYFYRQALPELPELFTNVPHHAAALCEVIDGNEAYEDLLYNRLAWQRPAN